jgi:hypothetical protein
VTAVFSALTVKCGARLSRLTVLAVGPKGDEMSTGDLYDDISRKAFPFWALWGAPIAIILSLNFISPPSEWATGDLAAGFAWMGVGCAINARRCHRRHCYYASPVFLIGSALVLLVGFGFVELGSDGLMYVTWGTGFLALLSFLPEKLFGKYRS